MKVLGVIPARGGSKGVPGKNVKKLGKWPLIAYSIRAGKESKLLEDLIVSTDDEEIKAIAEKYGAKVPFIRPANLATDLAKAIPVIQHALLEMEKNNGKNYDAVMMLQPTTPLRRVEDIDDAIRQLMEKDCDSVISVVDVEGSHPARMKYMEGDRLIDPPFAEAYENQPRQELPPMVIRNGAIYLTKRETLLSGSFKGEKSCALVMPKYRSVNIDTEWDFQFAEWLIGQKS